MCLGNLLRRSQQVAGFDARLAYRNKLQFCIAACPGIEGRAVFSIEVRVKASARLASCGILRLVLERLC